MARLYQFNDISETETNDFLVQERIGDFAHQIHPFKSSIQRRNVINEIELPVLDPGTSRRTDYLRDEVAIRLVERFMVVNFENSN